MKTKNRRPLETTLGKAPQIQKPPDLSHIRKPIETSIFGLRQVLSLFETSTAEVRDYISYECEILYECRICRTIFRSLANFILHKRNYCTEKYNALDQSYFKSKSEYNGHILIDDQISSSNEPNPIYQNEVKIEKSLSPIIEKLVEKHKIREIAKEALQEDLSVTAEKEPENEGESNLCLEKIETTDSAVFQTMFKNFTKENKGSEFIKSQVMEIHGILDSDEAIIGPDGKICNFETNKKKERPYVSKSNLVCTECDLKFSTKKTLTYHIKYKHNETRIVYPCPECKELLANAWCVYRHLYKVHRKTSTQIRKLREVIHNSAIRKDQQPAKKKDTKQEQEKANEENQWIKNVETDNDLQMCGGCGKRFERKAALYSHSQMCIKRIAVCNTIKENTTKTKYEQGDKNKDKLMKHEKDSIPVTLKGSKKRKPSIVITYKTAEKIPDHVFCKEDSESCNRDDVVDLDSIQSNKITSRIHSISSQSTDDEDYCSEDRDHPQYPSIDTLDTESVMNIIGVSSKIYHECSQMKNNPHSDNSNDEVISSLDKYDDAQNDNKIQLIQIEDSIILPKVTEVISSSGEINKENLIDMNKETISKNPRIEEGFISSEKNIDDISKEVQNCSIERSEYCGNFQTEDDSNKNNHMMQVNSIKTCAIETDTESIIIEKHIEKSPGDVVGNVHSVEAFDQFSEKIYQTIPNDTRNIDGDNERDSDIEITEKVSNKHIENNSDNKNCIADTNVECSSQKVETTCTDIKSMAGCINHNITITSFKESEDAYQVTEQGSLCNETVHQCQKTEVTLNAEVQISSYIQHNNTNLSEGIDVCNNTDLAETTSVDKRLYTDVNIADTAYINNDATEELSITDTTNTATDLTKKMSHSDVSVGPSISTDANLLDNELFSDLETDTCREQSTNLETIFIEANNKESPKSSDSPSESSPDVIVINDDDSDHVVQNDENIEYIINSYSESDDYENDIKDCEGSQQRSLCSSQNLKRKRTLSLDYPSYATKKKAVKIIDENEVLTDEHDVSFIAKAAPYMNQSTMSCISCEIQFPSLYLLLWHMSQHFSWFRFQCSRCSFMSFNKCDCVNHAKKAHSVSEYWFNSIVLPIPNWKTVLMSHEFCYLNSTNITPSFLEALNTQDSEQVTKQDINNTDDELYYGDTQATVTSIPNTSKQDDSSLYSTNYCNDSQTEVPQNPTNIKTCSEDSYIEISSSSDDSEVTHSDDSKKPNNDYKESDLISNQQHIFGTEGKISELAEVSVISEGKATTDVVNVRDLSQNEDKSSTVLEKIRPVRNRIKSVKASQSDFIYDLHNVLQLNNTQMDKPAHSRLKKTDVPRKSSNRAVSSKTLRVYSKTNTDADRFRSCDSKKFET